MDHTDFGAYYEVIELQRGYSSYNEEGTVAVSTCILIKGRYNCIINTMMPIVGEHLIKDVLAHNLLPTQINYLISTNGDSGYIGSNHLFLESTHVVGHTIAMGDSHFTHSLSYDKPLCLDCKKIIIMPTPGPTLIDTTVLVKTSKDTTIAITGGLIGKLEDLENNYLWLLSRPECPSLQRYNRDMIIKTVSQVIPEHGNPFDVTKEMKDSYRLHSEDQILSLREAYKLGLS